MAKLICGCGYLGMRVAERWLREGHAVWATTRSLERASAFLASGLQPLVRELASPFSLPSDIPPFDTVLFAVGFDRTAPHSLEQVYVGGLQHLVAALPQKPERFIYISSTGVYGQNDGEWVDELSVTLPNRPGGRACLAAEEWLASQPFGSQRIVLRLAGLYGPGRIPKLDDVRLGRPIAAREDGYVNLIHVADAAEIVSEVARRVSPPEMFVVSDGQPVLRGEFYGEVARLLNVPPPRFLSTSTEDRGSRQATDKRVDSRRLRTLLGRPLQYLSYREGLSQIVAEWAR